VLVSVAFSGAYAYPKKTSISRKKRDYQSQNDYDKPKMSLETVVSRPQSATASADNLASDDDQA
jgi:hypothetical protein